MLAVEELKIKTATNQKKKRLILDRSYCPPPHRVIFKLQKFVHKI